MILVVKPGFSKVASRRLLKLCNTFYPRLPTPQRLAWQIEQVTLALEARADPNAQNRTLDEFTTPLNGAASNGRPQLAQLLIDAGADLTWGPERSFDVKDLTDEDEVYRGVPLDALGVAMEAVSWTSARFDARDNVNVNRLDSELAVAHLLLDKGADPYLQDPATEYTPIDSFFRYLNNDGLSQSAPVDTLARLLERMMIVGPDLTPRLRQMAQGEWEMLDHGWNALRDFEPLAEDLRLKAKQALLLEVFPQACVAAKPRL